MKILRNFAIFLVIPLHLGLQAMFDTLDGNSLAPVFFMLLALIVIDYLLSKFQLLLAKKHQFTFSQFGKRFLLYLLEKAAIAFLGDQLFYSLLNNMDSYGYSVMWFILVGTMVISAIIAFTVGLNRSKLKHEISE